MNIISCRVEDIALFNIRQSTHLKQLLPIQNVTSQEGEIKITAAVHPFDNLAWRFLAYGKRGRLWAIIMHFVVCSNDGQSSECGGGTAAQHGG